MLRGSCTWIVKLNLLLKKFEVDFFSKTSINRGKMFFYFTCVEGANLLKVLKSSIFVKPFYLDVSLPKM